MKIEKYDSQESWMLARRGRVTGTRLKDLIVKRGTGKKKGYYEIIAERLSVPRDDENPMERGKRLESEAIARFMIETGKDVNTDLVIWSREDNPNIAVSPDGYISEYEAVECKCLNSASHIEVLLTPEVPAEYQEQITQYFCVNDSLETMYMVFYDPSIGYGKDFFFLTVHRDEEKVQEALAIERRELFEIDQIVTKLKNE